MIGIIGGAYGPLTVFFAVLLSTTLQGSTVEALARRLKLTQEDKPPPEAALSRAA